MWEITIPSKTLITFFGFERKLFLSKKQTKFDYYLYYSYPKLKKHVCLDI